VQCRESVVQVRADNTVKEIWLGRIESAFKMYIEWAGLCRDSFGLELVQFHISAAEGGDYCWEMSSMHMSETQIRPGWSLLNMTSSRFLTPLLVIRNQHSDGRGNYI
jgi:hypothetical protein